MANLKHRGRRSRREELLARIITLRPDVLEELAAYLVKVKDLDMLEDILDGLDKARILRDPCDPDAAAQYESTVLKPTLQRILQLSAIFKSLPLMKGTADETNFVKERCFQELIDRWGAVTKWIFHLLTEKQRRDPLDSLMTLYQWTCLVSISFLTPLFSQIDGDRYKEEFVSLPDTVNLMFALLCSTDPLTGKHCDVYKEGKEDSCVLLQRLWIPLTTSVQAREHIIERLSNCTPKYQKEIAKAFLSRAREFADNLQTEAQVNVAIRNLGVLFEVSSSLCWATFFDTGTSIWRLLDRQNFLYEYTSAVSKVTRKGQELNIQSANFWSSVNQCATTLTLMAVFAAPNPIKIVPQLIKGGLLPCILASIPKTVELWPPASHPFAIEALRMIYPFLYVEKVYSAFEASGGFDLMDSWNETARTTPAREIFDEWKALLWRSAKAYTELGEHEVLNINMCNNRKCPLHLARRGMGCIRPMICSSCHSATYCSKECQRQDWLDFHAAECAGLAQVYQDHKLAGRWPSWRTRRDQLIFLQLLANLDLPDPAQLENHGASMLRRFPKLEVTYPSRPHFDSDLPLTSVDLVKDRHLYVVPGISIAHMNQSLWAMINGALDRRVESCVRDMERNRDTVIIVEGKFPLDEQYVMWVFVKMEWDPEAAAMERYRIVSHAFRLGAFGWPENETPWLFQRQQQLEELGSLPFPKDDRH